MINVRRFFVGPLETNCYVLYKQGQAIVIDPGGDPSDVIFFLEKNGLELLYILNTHMHVDHILGNKPLQEATGATILANPEDEYLLETSTGKGGGVWGLPRVEEFSYEPLYPGEQVWLGEVCKVMHTPGHTKGSLSFYFPDSKMVFVGDLIFQGSVGRTDLPGGDPYVLLKSIKTKIMTLPLDTTIYPGHGPFTTVKDEKYFNPFLRNETLLF